MNKRIALLSLVLIMAFVVPTHTVRAAPLQSNPGNCKPAIVESVGWILEIITTGPSPDGYVYVTLADDPSVNANYVAIAQQEQIYINEPKDLGPYLTHAGFETYKTSDGVTVYRRHQSWDHDKDGCGPVPPGYAAGSAASGSSIPSATTPPPNAVGFMYAIMAVALGALSVGGYTLARVRARA